MAKPVIFFNKTLNKRLVVLDYEGNRAIWSRVKLRKHVQCPIFEIEMKPGDVAYRPIGNQSYRMVRLHAESLEKVIELIEAQDRYTELVKTEKS